MKTFGSLLVLAGTVSAYNVFPPYKSGKKPISSTGSAGGQTFLNYGLVAGGDIPAEARDKYDETIGGIGSALFLESLHCSSDHGELAISGTLLGLPDRGWNTEGTTDFRARIQKFDFEAKPYYGDSSIGQNLKLTYKDTLLLKTKKAPSSGLDPLSKTSDAIPLPIVNQTYPHLSQDSEGLVKLDDGTYWVSDEYGPYVYHYSAKGVLIEAIQPPAAFLPIRNGTINFSANSPPFGSTESNDVSPVDPVTGRQNNQGFEGLTVYKNFLYVYLQSALIQDGGNKGSTRRNTRILKYNIKHAPKLVGEYVVQLQPYGKKFAAGSEIHALSEDILLLLARDSGSGFGLDSPTSSYRKLDLLDLSKATNIAGTQYDGLTPVAPNGILDASVTPVTYSSFIDINNNTQLARFGYVNGASDTLENLDEKWEGIGIGSCKFSDDTFLFIASDNDFITQNGKIADLEYSDSTGLNVPIQVLVYSIGSKKN